MKQSIFGGANSSIMVEPILLKRGCHKFCVVCDESYQYLTVKDAIEGIAIPHVYFSGFSPNPRYEDICKGVAMFNSEGCDAIVAVGGGSAMDVAKCMKLFSRLDQSVLYLDQEFVDSDVPLIGLPTTAGTGSESTHFAVIYYEGMKQSVAHPSILPDCVVLDHGVLGTLPIYQKKCTMLDALCQAIESWWSVNATDESKIYARAAIGLILDHWKEYIFQYTDVSAQCVMLAANYSGRAINITQTTAAHAMSYKLTSMYNIPHGHAVAVCLPHVWRYMFEHMEACIDPRGIDYVKAVFCEIATRLGCSSVEAAIGRVEELLATLEITNPRIQSNDDLDILTASVNVQRLRNTPISLSEKALYGLYACILEDKE